MLISKAQFGFLDYFFFTIVFVMCLMIGLYFALGTKKHFSIEEYLFGGKKLNILSVIFSLAATTISGSSTIGQSMEMYAFGLHNWLVSGVSVMWLLIMHHIFLPVFYELQLMSTFTYLEMRFDSSVKKLASALYIMTGFLVIPLTIYVPALSFEEVTGINLYIITVILGLLCIWYTAIGGIKAVVWTDALQYILITGSGIVIMIVGLKSVGGFENVWKALDRGGRLTFAK